ncbi:ABC transporter substrate-binding protein [Micromonospora mirobrigensis]|uniref:Multiple sugar transport system substrate-binding protein n=1 Tax=Micromonospora mirobrigensis TaxID=262898 RepID=A0A1C4YZ83_9ACTN|nr:extracellular solute-binding protein [Micromonospora mirobrigensis]SCF25947.1 multiple sugar transport system substrate-binding protein [Micromonospora mirobrigensis]
MTTLTRRALLGGLLAGSLVLSGCSGADSGPAAAVPTGAAADNAEAQQPATISFLAFQSPNLPASFWQAQVKEIQKTYPKLKVELLYTPGLDRQGYAKQLLTTGNLPDVIWDVPLADFVKANALLPYSDADLATIDAPPSAGLVDGKHYSLTNGAQTIPMLYYNKKELDALGIAPPKTWQDLLTASAKIKAAGKTPILAGGASDAWASTILLDGIVDTDVYAAKPDWMTQRKQGKVKFSDPDMVAAVRKWQDLIKAGYVNQDALSLNYSQLQAKFTGGGGVFYPMGSWAGATKANFEIGVVPLPTADGKAVISKNFGQALYVSAKTKYPAQARAFAVAMATTPGAVTAQMKTDSLIPVAKGFTPPSDVPPLIRQTVDVYNTPGATATLPFGWEAGDQAAPSGFVDEWNSGAQRLYAGGSVEQFLKEMDQKFEDLNQG